MCIRDSDKIEDKLVFRGQMWEPGNDSMPYFTEAFDKAWDGFWAAEMELARKNEAMADKEAQNDNKDRQT